MEYNQYYFRQLESLRNGHNSFHARSKQKKFKRNLILAASSAVLSLSVIAFIFASNASSDAPIMDLIVAFLTICIIVSCIYCGHCADVLEDLGKPSASDILNLDLAVKSSETVRSIVLDNKFRSRTLMTKALARELFELARNECAGEQLRQWERINPEIQNKDVKDPTA